MTSKELMNRLGFDGIAWNNCPTLIMLVGIQCSGKSTLASMMNDTLKTYNRNVIIHSSDSLRKEIFGSCDVQNRNNELFQELHHRIKKSLINNNIVIYDATNINKKKRKAFLHEISYINCRKICVCVMTDFDECVSRCSERTKSGGLEVPFNIMSRTYMNWQPPYFDEGWDYIFFVTDEPKTNSIFSLVDDLKNYDQNTPHHNLSLGDHIEKCALNSHKYYLTNHYLEYACLCHDIGKPFCRIDTNKHGVYDGKSHYYNHNNVSAYLSVLYCCNVFNTHGCIIISNLVYWHMLPYDPYAIKTLNRIKEDYGIDFYNMLMKLHECDVAAH